MPWSALPHVLRLPHICAQHPCLSCPQVCIGIQYTHVYTRIHKDIQRCKGGAMRICAFAYASYDCDTHSRTQKRTLRQQRLINCAALQWSQSFPVLQCFVSRFEFLKTMKALTKIALFYLILRKNLVPPCGIPVIPGPAGDVRFLRRWDWHPLLGHQHFLNDE